MLTVRYACALSASIILARLAFANKCCIGRRESNEYRGLGERDGGTTPRTKNSLWRRDRRSHEEGAPIIIRKPLIRSVTDLYRLQRAQLLKLERVGWKTAGAPLEQIDRSRSAGLTQILLGLGIRFVGERTAELLAQHFGLH